MKRAPRTTPAEGKADQLRQSEQQRCQPQPQGCPRCHSPAQEQGLSRRPRDLLPGEITALCRPDWNKIVPRSKPASFAELLPSRRRPCSLANPALPLRLLPKAKPEAVPSDQPLLMPAANGSIAMLVRTHR